MFSLVRLYACVVLLVSLFAVNSVAQVSPSFTTATQFPTGGTKPVGVAVGDLNGDGKLDLVVVNETENNVAVLLGNGDGTFRAPVTYSLGATGFSPTIAVGDFNNDGKLDVVVDMSIPGGLGNNSLFLFLGNGDGTLRPPTNLPGYDSPFQMIAADINGDKNIDLLISGNGDPEIFFGNGNGTFQPSVGLAGDGTGNVQTASAIADFNGDGRPDIASISTGSSPPNMLVYLQNPGGSFAAPSIYPISSNPQFGGGITAGDINGDGKADVVAGTSAGDGAIFFGNGDGTFQLPYAQFQVFSEFVPFLLADFNNDKRPELETGDYTDPRFGVSVYTNPGNGMFSVKALTTLLTGGGTTQVAYGDFNNDGVLDVVSCDSTANVVSVFLSTIGTTVSVTASPNSITSGQQVTLTAAVAPSVKNSNQPTGTVSFLDGSTTLGSGPLASGTATLTSTLSTAGTHNITASYSGDANFVASNSASSAPVVVTDFSLAAANTSLSVTAGGSATTTITVTPLGGAFTSAISLSCSGAPSLSTCTINPSSVTPGGSPAQATLTIQTTAPSALNLHPRSRTLWAYAVWLPFMGVLLPGIGRRNRAFFITSLAVLLLIVSSACGGSSGSSNPSQPGTPAGNYTITVSGVSGGVTHTTSVTLTVH